MTDPALEAATRAMKATTGWHEPNYHLIVAAREAIKPIRELHAPHWSNCINACCSGEQCKHRSRLCGGCDEYWPCATARLVYAEEELS